MERDQVHAPVTQVRDELHTPGTTKRRSPNTNPPAGRRATCGGGQAHDETRPRRGGDAASTMTSPASARATLMQSQQGHNHQGVLCRKAHGGRRRLVWGGARIPTQSLAQFPPQPDIRRPVQCAASTAAAGRRGHGTLAAGPGCGASCPAAPMP